MVGTQVDQQVFQRLIERELPAIHTKMSCNKVELHLLTLQWFLCGYLCTFPTETALRVWDWFFLKGPRVMFDVAIALLKMNEYEILHARGASAMYALIRDLGTNTHDPEQLMTVLNM